MKKVLLALSATFAVCLAVFAGKNMCLRLDNGQVIKYNVDRVYEVYFEDIFNPDTSAIVPPFIEPSIADSADFYPLMFRILTDSTVELSNVDLEAFYDNPYPHFNINIPAKVRLDGKVYDVTSVGDNVIGVGDWEGQFVESIEIPSSVTEIGSDAFGYCSNLESINVDAKNPNYSSLDGILYLKDKTVIIAVPKGIKGSISIPSSVTEIGSFTFSHCSSLTSIEIPSSVTSIGEDAFYNCSSLTSVEIPSSVTSIGSEAFEDCSSLTSVAIPSSVTSIGSDAFAGCGSLTSIEIPSSVTEIGERAFYGCWSLTSIEIPSSVTSIGSEAFAGCGSLTSIEIPSSVTEIGSYAFRDCSSLTSIEIPSSVTSIEEDAFYGCWSLTSIEIPSSVTSIGSYAFFDCWSLTSIEIPSSVTEIGSDAFGDCSSLESINVDAKNPNYSSLDGVVYNKEKTEIIAVPEGIKGSISIPSSVTEIGSYAFGDCSSLESINVDAKNPNYSSLDGVVYNKEKTEIIAVPEGIKGSISIPSSVTSIGGYAFYYCRSLTSIEIPSSVTEIGERAFYNCSSLTSIEIPSSVTSIGYDAFYGCKNLDVVIDNSKENVEVGWNAFDNVKSVNWLK